MKNEADLLASSSQNPGFSDHLFSFLVGLKIDATVISRNACLSVTVGLAGMVFPNLVWFRVNVRARVQCSTWNGVIYQLEVIRLALLPLLNLTLYPAQLQKSQASNDSLQLLKIS
jgi:hypothetical protein